MRLQPRNATRQSTSEDMYIPPEKLEVALEVEVTPVEFTG